ncbi:MAG TPA: VOC family protein [candidate division Zixibacteria bacterium]|nr:VOC family protein [candidate division Zixibacteria bacterium]
MANAVNWFEIPATDFKRANDFYNTVFETELVYMEGSDSSPMGMFPTEDGVSGAVIAGEGYVPSTKGSVVYLNGGEDLNDVLNRVEAAGGQVMLAKMAIGENGFVAFFMDSEGNRVGLHSMG